MKWRFTRLRRAPAALMLAVVGAVSALGAEIGLPEKNPEVLGFSSARLERIPAMLRREIDAAHYAGAVWLVARNGSVVSHGALGWRDVPGRAPMSENTEFRIFSMTKIVTTVTALTLLEEGRISLTDPVERFLPKLANRQVLVGGTAEAPELVPAWGPITIRHLLTQTSGLTYDIFATGALKTFWTRADLWHTHTLNEFVDKVATLPLAHQPGANWTYGVNTDILGAVIEAVTGEDLETAVRKRVLSPLGMTRTTFRPGPAISAATATIHHRTPSGGLEKDEFWTGMGTLEFPSGGGGLFSTLHDYARFAQMLLNGGELDGARILGPKTVDLMRSNQIAHLPIPENAFAPPGFGFGVRVWPADSHKAKALGSPGEFGWDGAATTFVSMDPKEHVLLLLLMQHVPYDEGGIFEEFQDTAYQALEAESP